MSDEDQVNEYVPLESHSQVVDLDESEVLDESTLSDISELSDEDQVDDYVPSESSSQVIDLDESELSDKSELSNEDQDHVPSESAAQSLSSQPSSGNDSHELESDPRNVNKKGKRSVTSIKLQKNGRDRLLKINYLKGKATRM